MSEASKPMKLSSLKQQIEELDAKATKGPWIPDENRVCTSDLWDLIANTCHYNEERGFANRDFIALSRTALPELLRRLLVEEEAASAAAKALNLDDDNSWAADDREGAIDFAHSKLTAALATIRGEEE